MTSEIIGGVALIIAIIGAFREKQDVNPTNMCLLLLVAAIGFK